MRIWHYYEERAPISGENGTAQKYTTERIVVTSTPSNSIDARPIQPDSCLQSYRLTDTYTRNRRCRSLFHYLPKNRTQIVRNAVLSQTHKCQTCRLGLSSNFTVAAGFCPCFAFLPNSEVIFSLSISRRSTSQTQP